MYIANFKSIQDSHSINIKGALPPFVRTGYEHVVAHRVDSKFATVAKNEGKVTDLSNHHIEVTYKDGKKESFPIGEFYGKSGGHNTPKSLFTDYTLGQKVNQGDVITFNPYFFSRDIFVKGQVLFKYATVVRTALMEVNDTHEDSSAISDRFNDAFTTEVIKIRNLVLPFETEIFDLVRVGDTIDTDDILCTLSDAVFSENNMFSDDDLSTLSELAQSTPRAKYSGIVSKIEVLYMGDPINASNSIQEVIDRYDHQRTKASKALGKGDPQTGRLYDTMRIDGETLQENQLCIRIYIKTEDGITTGD